MKTFLKVTAVIAMIVTAAAACVVYYGWRNLAPAFISGAVTVSPASEEHALFEEWTELAALDAFPGSATEGAEEAAEADCEFVAYTVRLSNRGFFPAEWISLTAETLPGDLMVRADTGAHVLPAATEGELSLVLLRKAVETDDVRTLRVTCYALGEKQTLALSAQEGGISLAAAESR